MSFWSVIRKIIVRERESVLRLHKFKDFYAISKQKASISVDVMMEDFINYFGVMLKLHLRKHVTLKADLQQPL